MCLCVFVCVGVCVFVFVCVKCVCVCVCASRPWRGLSCFVLSALYRTSFFVFLVWCLGASVYRCLAWFKSFYKFLLCFLPGFALQFCSRRSLFVHFSIQNGVPGRLGTPAPSEKGLGVTLWPKTLKKHRGGFLVTSGSSGVLLEASWLRMVRPWKPFPHKNVR